MLNVRKVRPIDIQDDFRINIAKELSAFIEDKLKIKSQNIYDSSKVLGDD